MPHDFQTIEFTEEFDKDYANLPESKKEQCRKAIKYLKTDTTHPGLGYKPIKPAKVYWEARINRPDRIVVRPEGETAYLMAIEDHDNLDKWG